MALMGFWIYRYTCRVSPFPLSFTVSIWYMAFLGSWFGSGRSCQTTPLVLRPLESKRRSWQPDELCSSPTSTAQKTWLPIKNAASQSPVLFLIASSENLRIYMVESSTAHSATQVAKIGHALQLATSACLRGQIHVQRANGNLTGTSLHCRAVQLACWTPRSETDRDSS
jgi:hypothetical protein